MSKATNSLYKDSTVRLTLSLILGLRQWFSNVRNMNPSRNFILSDIRCKSHQIILEGIAYE